MKYCDTCRSSYPNEFNVCPIDNTALLVTSELITGMIIRDKYLILDKVGEGGMGMVFRTRHLAFNEIRALKIVHQSYAEDKAFIKRFKTEAVIARKLQHPNAVRIDDLDSTEDGRPFIVMEMVEGGNLKSLIAETGALPVDRALRIATQAAEALTAAHSLGIVHRDIKPDNILIIPSTLDGNDFVKVVDFGIAKVREGTLDVGEGYTATRSGLIAGTPQYLSPEQAMGMHGDQLDGRADIYSLGTVLYVILTGQLPFNSDTPMGFLMHHVQTRPVAPHIIRPDLNIPQELSAVLMKALEKDRNNRFASADEMARALRGIQGSLQDTPGYAPRIVQEPARALGDSSEGTALARHHGTPVVKAHESGTSKRASERKRIVVWSLVAVSLVAVGTVLAVVHFSNGTRTGQNRPNVTVSPTGVSTNGVDRDRSIRNIVEQGIASLKGSSIQIRVQNGVVTLSGQSPSKDDAQRAELLASQADGVKIVRNEIQVVPGRSAPAPTTTATVDQGSGPKTNKAAAAEQPKKATNADVEKLISAGNQATEKGEYDSAISSFQEALRASPHNATAQAGLHRAQQAKQTEESVLNPK